jgi:hypothetical protein
MALVDVGATRLTNDGDWTRTKPCLVKSCGISFVWAKELHNYIADLLV